jgi:hypothetical protein
MCGVPGNFLFLAQDVNEWIAGNFTQEMSCTKGCKGHMYARVHICASGGCSEFERGFGIRVELVFRGPFRSSGLTLALVLHPSPSSPSLVLPSSLFYTSQGPFLFPPYLSPSSFPSVLFPWEVLPKSPSASCQADLHDPRPAHSNHSWSQKSPLTFFYTYNYPLGPCLDHTIFGNS